MKFNKKAKVVGVFQTLIGAALTLVLAVSVATPANADTTAGNGSSGGTQSGSSTWYWAYGDRPGDAWNAFAADWGSGVRVSGNSLIASNGYNTGANLDVCRNSAQIWWIHFNRVGSQKFWGIDPEYLIDGRTPSSWVGEQGLSGAAREARGWVPAGTVLSNGQTTTSGAYFPDLVRSYASSWVASNTSNTSSVVLVCSELQPAMPVVEEGTQTRTVTNGVTSNAPSSFTTAVQRQVLNTTSATVNDNGVDLIGNNNLHDQAASPLVTNYGQVLTALTNGSLYGTASLNDLTRAQWDDFNNRIAAAKLADTTLEHRTLDLDTANRTGLAEGGVLNVSEWAQRATVTTTGSQTYTDYWRYTGVRYWSGAGWGPVQNIQWTDTRLSTVPAWDTANGWTLSSQNYSITNSSPTQENTGFWQLLSVHCNVDQLNALKAALTAAGRSATVIEQTNHDDGTITAILRTPVRNQGWADVPASNAVQQNAVNSAQVTLANAQASYNAAVAAHESAVAAANSAQIIYNAAQSTFNVRTGNLASVSDNLNVANTAVTSATATYNTIRTNARNTSATLRQYVADAPGLSSSERSALTGALTTFESTYASGSVAVPSTASTNAVQRVTTVSDNSDDQVLIGFAQTYLSHMTDFTNAWTTLNDASTAQATAQTALQTGEASLTGFRTLMNTAADDLEDANDYVEQTAATVATRSTAVENATNAVSAANAALTAANGVTNRVWSPARPSVLDFGDARNSSSALAASGYVGFYDKECVTDCTTDPASSNATARNGANGNASNTGNLGHKDSFGGAVLTDSTVRESGNTSPSTNSNYLEIFRDNSQSRTVRVNTAYPDTAGTNFNYDGSAAFTTTVNIWGMSTPDTNPTAGQFFMTATNITNRAGAGTTEKLFDGLNGTSIWTNDLSRAPATQKNFGNDLYSTGISETFSGFANTFQVGATWASESDRPVVLNIKWEYRPTTFVTVPSSVGFGAVAAGSDNASRLRIAGTQDVLQALDVRCYAQYGVTDSLANNLSSLTQQFTGTGTSNQIDTQLLTPANGDDSYRANNNLVLKFIRGVAE